MPPPTRAFLESMLHRRSSALVFASAIAVSMAAPEPLAQSRARILGLELGTPVASLPVDQWVEPACGTNGGPPSLRLASFEEFGRCPVEAATGLHEVWFIYDDEWEYIARAYGDPVQIRSFSANVFYGQPIITSLLVDDGGLVQGYRVVTDPRAPTGERVAAYELHATFKALFTGAPWQCVALNRTAGEDPVEGVFLKEDCVMASEQRFIRLEGRHLRKPGQSAFAIPPEGYFESSVRLEVYNSDAVRDALCCRPSAPAGMAP